jgi:adenylylsulfate kinase
VGPAEEEIVHRTLVYAAKLLTEAGVPAIIDATAPRRAWRQLARDLIADFAEVELVCPPEICRDRERAVRWNPTFCASGARRKTAAGAAPDVLLDYERSLNPELIVHTHVRDPWSATQEILALAHRLHRAALRHLDLA